MALPLTFMTQISVEFRKKVAGAEPASLARFASKAGKQIGLPRGVGIVITSNAEMKRMNAWFRNKSKPTDVLSFVACGIKDYAGDIAISADIARNNARKFRHTPAEELKVLVLHGLLHLSGMDHEKDDGEMAHREAELRKVLSLPATLSERHPTKRAKVARPR
jgi:probable rRNA maturation factor